MDSSWSLERSAVAAELKRSVAEKCAQVRAEVRALGHAMVPESRSLFAAAGRRLLPWAGSGDAVEQPLLVFESRFGVSAVDPWQ